MARYDILLKDGLIVDPAQKRHHKGSVAIKDGKIAKVADSIPEEDAARTYELEGMIVTPGLIDIHCHLEPGFAHLGMPTDEIGIGTGVTLLCDAGTAGYTNYRKFKGFLKRPRPKTDVFCFLNVARNGLTSIPEFHSKKDINFQKTRAVIENNRDSIKGVKIRAVEAVAETFGLAGVETAKRLAEAVGLPLMLHIGETRPRAGLKDPLDDFSRAAVSLLDKGDILSHYLTWEPGGMILQDGTVYPELVAARERGVLLDSCHGLNHFCFNVVRHAIEKKLLPDLISTDMASMVQPSAQSLAIVMSKFMCLGLTLDQVVEMTTIGPAKAVGEEESRGSLKQGAAADISVMELLQGSFRFIDRRGGSFIAGDRRLEPRMVFKSGRPYPAWSRYHIPRYESL